VRVWQQLSSRALQSICRRVLFGMELATCVYLWTITDGKSIYRPTKTATQSGNWTASGWLMDWDVLPKGHRWENPLMGWQSSADFMNGHRIQFKTKEDAINFANKQGYEYFVQEPNERKFVPKAYANLFTYKPGKLKVVYTK
jgi:NADH dehydrogenase (ubiquinone) Fe-S protein 4